MSEHHKVIIIQMIHQPYRHHIVHRPQSPEGSLPYHMQACRQKHPFEFIISKVACLIIKGPNTHTTKKGHIKREA